MVMLAMGLLVFGVVTASQDARIGQVVDNTFWQQGLGPALTGATPLP
jgi:hypothetical protein